MIKKLKYKFVLIIMIILLLVFTFILITINYISYKIGEQQCRDYMEKISYTENFRKPLPSSPSVPPVFFDNTNTFVDFVNNYYRIVLTSDNVIKNVYGHIGDTAMTDDELIELVSNVLSQDKTYGDYDKYKFLIKHTSTDTIIVIINNTIEHNVSSRLIKTSLIIGVISLFVLFFVALFLSNIIIKPVQETFDKQKQFICDASHELKTPISTISVNADALKEDIGDNKWLNYIKSETSRMDTLTKDLLSIARLDSDTKNTKLNFSEFDIGKATEQMVLTFESIAYESDKQYRYNIQKNIKYKGNEESIKQLVAIFIDNALKNSDENGLVQITLKKHNSKILLEVYNTGKGIPISERAKIFERFYRSDTSRSRETGSFGLGLAIAKSIVTKHHGKINVTSEVDSWVKFTVIL